MKKEKQIVINNIVDMEPSYFDKNALTMYDVEQFLEFMEIKKGVRGYSIEDVHQHILDIVTMFNALLEKEREKVKEFQDKNSELLLQIEELSDEYYEDDEEYEEDYEEEDLDHDISQMYKQKEEEYNNQIKDLNIQIEALQLEVNNTKDMKEQFNIQDELIDKLKQDNENLVNKIIQQENCVTDAQKESKKIIAEAREQAEKELTTMLRFQKQNKEEQDKLKSEYNKCSSEYDRWKKEVILQKQEIEGLLSKISLKSIQAVNVLEDTEEKKKNEDILDTIGKELDNKK